MGSTRVSIDFIGCKLNQAETEDIGRRLAETGCILVSADAPADIYILNTCTVTQTADRKSRQMLRTAKRRNPGARIIATGCYAQRMPEEIARIQEVDLIIDNEEKHRLPQILEQAGYVKRTTFRKWEISGFRTRTFIRIQEGCSRFCTYCIVPLVRGKEKSIPAEQVISEVEKRVTEGYREVVLTGTEIGTYRDNVTDLKRLLERILSETDIARLRLSSLQPQEILPELITLWQNERLCRHFHLSLQSGSDSVLQRMKRRYSIAGYRRAVDLIREQIPGAGITTDIITGFPGESDAEFAESHDFCRQMAFARIHVFSYSPREGTEAAHMPGRIQQSIKISRRDRMLALAEESSLNFRRGFLDKNMSVLWEKQNKGIWSGLTDNYIRIYTKSNRDLTNTFTDIKLERLYREGGWGEPANAW